MLARRLTGGLRLGRPQSSGFARRNLSRQALLVVSVLYCRRRAGSSSRAVHSGRWRPSSRVLRMKRGSQVAKCDCGRRATRLLERRATAHGRDVFRFTPFFRLRSGRPITVDKLRYSVKRLYRASTWSVLMLELIPCGSVAPLPSSRPALTSTSCARWGARSAIAIASTCGRALARRSSGRSAPARPWLTTLLASLRRLMATKVSFTRRGSEAAAGLRPGSANYPSEGSYLGPAPFTVRRAARFNSSPAVAVGGGCRYARGGRFAHL